MKTKPIIKRLITTGVAVFAFAALPLDADAETLPETMAGAKKAFKNSADWLDGKLDPKAPKVTYAGDPIRFRITMHTPPVSGLTKFNKKAAGVLEEMSNGKIKVTFRPGGVVHNVREGFEANRNNLTDMSPCFVFLNATNFPLTQGLSLPGLFPNAAVMQVVVEKLYPKYFKQEFERQGVYASGFVGSPRFRIFSTEPILKLEDLNGKKVRSGTGINQDIFQALGAATVNFSSREFQQRLKLGTIDAIFTSDSAAMIFKLTKVAKHHLDVNINHTQLDWCMNKRTVDAMPGDLRKVFNDWARAKFQAETQQAFLRVVVIARSRFKEAGMQFNVLSDEEFVRWENAYASVTEDYLKQMEGRGLPAKEMVADIKAEVAKLKNASFNDLMTMAVNDPNQDFTPGVK